MNKVNPMNIALVVNDVPSNLMLITAQLLRLNYQVVTASLKADALEIARRLAPTLIFLDLSLPDGDGIDALIQLREHAETRHIPVIVVSARSSYEDQQRVFDAGANGYLVKPYNLADLEGIAQRFLADIPEQP